MSLWELTSGPAPEGALRAEVEALEPGFEPAWYTGLNPDQGRPAWFFARRRGVLAGFLTVFAPSDEEAEVQAWVAPAFRRQGAFSALWTEARRVWDQGQRWLLVVDRWSQEGTAAARGQGLWEFAEKTLVLGASNRPPRVGFDPGWVLVAVDETNLEAAVTVQSRASGGEGTPYRAFAQRVMADPERRLLALEHAGQVAALVGLHRAGTVTELFSLAVDPDHQGRGLGRRLVTEALWLEPAETYQLEVDSSNVRAETLYRSLGFEDLEVTDYYLVQAP